MLLAAEKEPVDKPRSLRQQIATGTVTMPGAFNAPVAMLAEQLGFSALYISGAGLINSTAGYPDIGLLSMDEMVREASYIANAVKIPAICDADTGYGEVLQVMRTVQAFERAGLAGIHLEDQQAPKRCGHLAGKTLITPAQMEQKLAAAVEARQNPDFMLIARTDARAVEGLDAAIDRALRYLDAGADAIFAEAMQTPEEFGYFADKVKGPLLANMTEFGKSPYLSVDTLAALGYCMVIFPMSAFRVMMKSVEDLLSAIRDQGTPKAQIDRMQTRQELYQLLQYDRYTAMDNAIAQRFPED